MSLLDFEHAARETNSALSNWFSSTDMAVRADGTGPFGYGRAMFTFSTVRNLPGNYTTLWANFHFYQFGAASATGLIFSFRDAGSNQVSVGLDNLNRVYVAVGASIVATSAPNVWALNAWYFLQLRASIANAGGNIQVWLQGTKIIDFTGDTQSTANNYVNQWQLSRNNNNTDLANVIIYDEVGNAPNARTPETRIFADLPTGAGAATAWTPSAGANWQNVDEQPNDGDTTYNSAAAAALDDLYGFPAGTIPGASVVYAVAHEFDVRKDDAGTNDVDSLIRSGGTTYAKGTPVGLTSTWQRFRAVWDTDPATGAAWTVANANAAQVGIRRTT